MFDISILYDVLRGNHNRITRELTQKNNSARSSAKVSEPRVLWLGCSDSELSSSLISGLDSGQTLMHCNLANQIRQDDLSFQSVLEYALQDLSIQHIVICGHYGCKGIMSALKSEADSNVNMNDWLNGIYRLAAQHGDELRTLPSLAARADRLAELNVLHQAELLEQHPLVAKNKITILAWMHNCKSGKIKDLRRAKRYSGFPLSSQIWK